jgi:hypothetical protein
MLMMSREPKNTISDGEEKSSPDEAFYICCYFALTHFTSRLPIIIYDSIFAEVKKEFFWVVFN